MAAYQTDTSIADEILQALAAVLPRHRINVLVHDGRVTLRGTVAEPGTRRTIKDVVGDVDGVNAITDLISVQVASPAGDSPKPAAIQTRSGKRTSSRT